MLYPRTDQTGVVVSDPESPHLAQSEFGAALTHTFGGTQAVLTQLKKEFPDLARIELMNFAQEALPGAVTRPDFVVWNLPSAVPATEIRPVPEGDVAVTPPAEVLPPNITPVEPVYIPAAGGGGGFTPSPPAPNPQIPPEGALHFPRLSDVLDLLDFRRVPKERSSDELSNQSVSTGSSSTGTSPTGTSPTGTSPTGTSPTGSDPNSAEPSGGGDPGSSGP